MCEYFVKIRQYVPIIYLLMNLGYYIVLFMFSIVTQLPCFFSLLVCYPLYKITGSSFMMKIPQKLQMKALGWMDKLFFNIQTIKLHDFDTSQRYVYLLNHQAYVDPVIGRCIENFFVVTIANGYVKYIPVFGKNAYMLDIPFVGKDKGITQLYTDYLKKNQHCVLAMFPEGHRMFENDFKLADIKTGGFVIAKNTGLKIVPLYHNMMDKINDVKKEYHSTLPIYCLFGKPIEVEGREIDDIKQEYFDAMTDMKHRVNELRNKGRR